MYTYQQFDILGSQSVYMARSYLCITLWAQVYATIYIPILVTKKETRASNKRLHILFLIVFIILVFIFSPYHVISKSLFAYDHLRWCINPKQYKVYYILYIGLLILYSLNLIIIFDIIMYFEPNNEIITSTYLIDNFDGRIGLI